MKIMIAEDNASMRKAIRGVAAKTTDIVFECGNGEEAVSIYAQHHPDWVVMDINMPVLDGISATRQIISKHPAACIVMITDNKDEAFRRASEEAGAKGFVSKENLFAISDFIHQ